MDSYVSTILIVALIVGYFVLKNGEDTKRANKFLKGDILPYFREIRTNDTNLIISYTATSNKETNALRFRISNDYEQNSIIICNNCKFYIKKITYDKPEYKDFFESINHFNDTEVIIAAQPHLDVLQNRNVTNYYINRIKRFTSANEDLYDSDALSNIETKLNDIYELLESQSPQYATINSKFLSIIKDISTNAVGSLLGEALKCLL